VTQLTSDGNDLETARCLLATPTVCCVSAARPNPAQWVWYALGGGLPRHLSGWVLEDTTRRSWVLRHLARALVQLSPVVVLCLLVPPVPMEFRVSAAIGGTLIGLLFSLAYMTETTEHRAVKAGHPPGTTARVRAERVERERLEKRARYRDGGSGSFD
jgi:hypothetical protein